MSLTHGGLFEGYGGLSEGVQSVLGGDLAWYAEYDTAPSKILAHHHPGIPNLGDVTKVDWSAVPKVDVITGGSPCQDLSHAGKRAGMNTGTRSNLWVEMREAIAVIRPRLVVWENVAGALSAEAGSESDEGNSEVESRAGSVGDRPGRPSLRALGRVLGDLASLGYDARWYGLRAADVGAAHGRFRVFVFASPADADDTGLQGLADQARTSPTGRHGHAEPSTGRPDLESADLNETLTLLPTPACNDMGAGKTPDAWDAWTDRMKAEHGNGNGHGKSLEIEALRLLPTPESSDASGSRVSAELGGFRESGAKRAITLATSVHHLPTTMDHKASGGYNGQANVTLTDATVRQVQDWAQYEAAIRRHEAVLGRPAPAPTEPGNKGQPRLSPVFVEWLMMLPAGHVTDPAIGISRNDQLKALGNGVVPPQCAAATRQFVADVASKRDKAVAAS